MGEVSASDRPASSGWGTVGAAVVAMMIGPSVVLLMSFGVFLPALHAEFGWSVERIALGASIISIAVMLLSPVQGWLADRVGGRRLILIFVPLWAIGLLAMSMLPARLEIFYLACALLPLGALGLWPLSFMKVVASCFDRRLGLALGMSNLGVGMGAILLPLILAPIFANWGWRAAYMLIGVCVLFITWPTVFFALREGAGGTRTDAGGRVAQAVGIGVGEAVSTLPFWVMILSFPVLGMVSTGMLVHQVSILVDGGMTSGAAIAIQAGVGAGSLAGRIGAGWLLDRMSARVVGMGTFVAAGVGCAILASPAAAQLGLAASLLFGVVIGAEFDVLAVMIRRYQGIRSFGRIYGLAFSAFQLGGALGAAGLAFSRARFDAYGPGLWTLCVLSVVGAGLFSLLGPYRYATDPHMAQKARGSDD